jgi:hypothetical protein
VLAASIITHFPDDVDRSTSETLVNFYQTTRRYNQEDSHIHTRRRENLKSFLVLWLVTIVSGEHMAPSFEDRGTT